MKRVLAAGDVNVDIVATGTPKMPELGVEMFVDDISVQLGGSAVTCACGLARLSIDITFLGKLGNDGFGQFIRDTLAARGIDMSHLLSSHLVRTGITMSVAHDNERAFLTYSGSVQTLRPEDAAPRCLDGFNHLHMASYFLQEPFQLAFLQLLKKAKSKGLSTSFDTGCDPNGDWNSGLADLFPYAYRWTR